MEFRFSVRSGMELRFSVRSDVELILEFNFGQRTKGIYRINRLCGHNDIRGTTMDWIVIVDPIYLVLDCNGRQQ